MRVVLLLNATGIYRCCCGVDSVTYQKIRLLHLATVQRPEKVYQLGQMNALLDPPFMWFETAALQVILVCGRNRRASANVRGYLGPDTDEHNSSQ